MKFKYSLLFAAMFAASAIAADTDGDGYDDLIDRFPNDPLEFRDSDCDGIGDESDPDSSNTIDSDGDGVIDGKDPWPANVSMAYDFDCDGVADSVDGDLDGDGIPNADDIDDDGDGISDFPDAFPTDPYETLDTDDDGVGNRADEDDDGDSYLDIEDDFPENPNEHDDMDSDGIGNNSDDDTDGDGILNTNDLDDDNDGTPDAEDAFVLNPDEQVDTDNDSIGNNRDEDDDNDGVIDSEDSFPLDATEQNDSDGDGVGDNLDTHPYDPNETTDHDNDGIGDNADNDDDNDGVDDADDLYPLDATESADTDGDGVGNTADSDDDNDGVNDDADAFPLDASETLDTDGDGIGNNTDPDDDNDGVDDTEDLYPLDSSESTDTDGDGVGNNVDNDDDNDGVLDQEDDFPLDATESEDTDGDGIGNNTDTDDDNDGIVDVADMFPLDSSETIDTDGDGIGNNADTDDDNDGVSDDEDELPFDPTGYLDTDGDGIPNSTDPDIDGDGILNSTDQDDDGDGVTDDADAFVNNPHESIDTDNDGIGNNADDNDDGDSALDVDDAFPLDARETLDSDLDGIGDNADVFPFDPSEHVDTDGDGIGNNADEDDDNDGIPDDEDAFPLGSEETHDTDGDGIGNNADLDDDGDGVNDDEDAFPLDNTEWLDTDNDGIGNNTDPDDDNDGVLDTNDDFPLDETERKDSDGDGIGDNTDSDLDGDGVNNEIDEFPHDATRAKNSTPNAVTDSVEIQSSTETKIYPIANDTDDDDQNLQLISAHIPIGESRIENFEHISYVPPKGYKGTIDGTYTVTDGISHVTGVLRIEIDTSYSGQPIISAPDDIDTAAQGPVSKVDLGFANAQDANGNNLTVENVTNSSVFKPGITQVFWRTEDTTGNEAYAKQLVNVEPTLSVTGPSDVSEGSSYTYNLDLNAHVGAEYDVEMKVRGTADRNDYTLSEEYIVVDSQTAYPIVVDVLQDGFIDDNEDLVLDFYISENLVTSKVINVFEIAPLNVELSAVQAREKRTSVLANSDRVIIKADVLNQVAGTNLTYEFTSKPQMQDLDNVANQLTLDTSNSTEGVIEVTVHVTDTNLIQGRQSSTLNLRVLEKAPALGLIDSDKDGVPDVFEGFKDINRNGLMDYLDNSPDCSVINSDARLGLVGLIQTNSENCITMGKNAQVAGTGLAIEIDDHGITADSEFISLSSVMDFKVEVQGAGQTASIVIPLATPAHSDSVYRKYDIVNGTWGNFEVTLKDLVWSTEGQSGVCPNPDSPLWQKGISPNAWCVKIDITDGGPNDDDGEANGIIVDPGYIAKQTNNSEPPIANSDSALVEEGETVTVNVMANDTHPESTDENPQALTLVYASAELGEATILNQAVVYTAPANFSGSIEIVYAIEDDSENRTYGTLIVEVQPSFAPLLTNDEAETTQAVSVEIDVLANDTDLNDDALSITMVAKARHGKTSVTGNGYVLYEPNPNFVGEEEIDVYVTDGEFEVVSKLNISVLPAAQQDTVVKGGGSMSMIAMFLLGGMLLLKRLNIRLFATAFALLGLSTQATAQGYYSEHSHYFFKGALAKTLVAGDGIEQRAGTASGFTVVDITEQGFAYELGFEYQMENNWGWHVGYKDLGSRNVKFTGTPIYNDYYEQAVSAFPESAAGLTAGLSYTYEYEGVTFKPYFGLMTGKIESFTENRVETIETIEITDSEGNISEQEETVFKPEIKSSFEHDFTKPYIGVAIGYQTQRTWHISGFVEIQALDRDNVVSVGVMATRPFKSTFDKKVKRFVESAEESIRQFFD